jgi:rRNA processing protein Gar1
MASIIDIIASMIFGGTLFLIVLSANGIATETQTTYHGDMLVQEVLIGTVQMVEGELRNMGFGVPENERTIVRADSTAISFLTDLGRDGGVPDTVKYSIGTVSELSDTPNELDRFLKRKVNNQQLLDVGTVTTFGLKYFTREGDQLATPVATDQLNEIHVVEVTMEVQNPYALARPEEQVQAGERDALYSSSLWQQTRLASQNTRR